MMDAMMDQLMADSFKSDGNSDDSEVVEAVEEDTAGTETVACPICQAFNVASAAQCGTCSYVF